MKKSSFVAMVLGTVSGVLFALGMCMALIAEWEACFSMVWGKMIQGIVIGLIGIAVLLCLVPLTKGIKE